MAQHTHNFTLHLGETHRQVFVFRDAANARLSLQGYAARMPIMNRTLPYGYTIMELTTGNDRMKLERDGVFDTDQATAGTLSILLLPGEIEDILWQVPSARQVVYTILLQAPNGDEIPVLGGTITLVG